MYNHRLRRRREWLVCLTLTMLAVSGSAFADGAAPPLPVDDFIVEAVGSSDSLADAQIALEEAAKALSPGFETDDIRLSISGSGRYSAGISSQHTMQDPFSPSASASLSIPIIPQIQAGAQLSTDFDTVSSSFSISASPFAEGSVTWRELEGYQQAGLKLASLTASLPYQIESAVYGYVTAAWSQELAEAKLALEEERFTVFSAQYAVGDISWSDFDAASQALSGAQRALFDAERSTLSARKQLVDSTGIELGTREVIRPSIEEIEAAIESRRNRISEETDQATTESVRSSQIALAALEAQLEATPLFDPSVSVSANADLPFSSVSLSASITLSPSQYQREERDDLAEAIAEQLETIEIEQRLLEFEIGMLIRQIESAERLYTVSIASEESARVACENTSYYHELGDQTDLELEEARISLESAQLNRYRNAVSLLSTLGDLVELIDLGTGSSRFVP